MSRFGRYLSTLSSVLNSAEATDRSGNPQDVSAALESMLSSARDLHARGDKVMFIGNGGSAAIASHMSEDFSKAAGIRALSFNDAPTLTCLGNDFGYEHVFEKQIEWFARKGDMLVAVSSSGRSPNILKAVEAAQKVRTEIITLSGFDPRNPLRAAGDLNFYLPSHQYGFVEAGHLALLSAVVDFAMGWKE